jgi:hypothetical protein
VKDRLQDIANEALKSAKIRRIERMESNMKKGSSISQFFNENASIKKSFQALKTKLKSDKKGGQSKVSFGGIDRSKTITKEPQELTEEQIMSFKQAFDLFDTDHSGAIDEDELYQAMKAIGLRTSKKECRKMIGDQDEDDNGEIDFPEFLEMMKIKMVRPFHTAYIPSSP